MKKLLVLSAVCIIAYLVYIRFLKPRDVGIPQSPDVGIPAKDFPLEGQWYTSSCWAATLSMAAKYVAPLDTAKNQCYFINRFSKSENQPMWNCIHGGDTTKVNKNTLKTDTSFVDAKTNPSLHRLVYSIDVKGPLNQLAKLISSTVDSSSKALNLTSLKKTKYPIIYAYQFGKNSGNSSTNKHVNLISDLDSVGYENISQQFIYIKDPWPQNTGSDYYLSYEQYKSQISRMNIIFGDNNYKNDTITTATYMNVIFNLLKHVSPDTIASRLFFRLKKDYANLNDKFKKRIGIDSATQFKKAKLGKVGIEIISSGSSSVTIYNNQLEIHDINDLSTFQQFAFFITQNQNILSAITISRNRNNVDSLRWFVGGIENGFFYNKKVRNKFNSASLKKSSKKFALVKIIGDINAIFLVSKTQKNNTFRIEETLFNGTKPIPIRIP